MKKTFTRTITKITENLSFSEGADNKWLRPDGTPCSNYIWKYASNTKAGTAGENLVCEVIRPIIQEKYGKEATVRIINCGIGDFDVEVRVPFRRSKKDRTITFEVKVATEDVNGYHQFNNLKKHADYDYVFLVGISPEEIHFAVKSHKYLNSRMTTRMSTGGGDSFKYTVRKEDLEELNYDNLLKTLEQFKMV